MVIATSLSASWSRLSVLCVLGLLMAFAPAPAPASATSWLGRALAMHFGDRRDPVAAPARYEIDTGGGFILDHGDRGLLLRFDDSPEVWVLTRARGPRGDIIFTDDLGQPLLRTTKFGGVTVFTRRHPDGSAAALAGGAAHLRPTPVSAGQLMQRLLVASVRASHAAGRPIAFNANGASAASSSVVADAALIASEAVITFSLTPGGRGVLSRVSHVDIAPGRRVATAFAGGVIDITVVPKDGLLGRPSSAMVMRALAAARGPGAAPGLESIYYQVARP